MEAVFLLLLVAACHGLPMDIPTAPQLLLPIPDIRRLETQDDPNNITSHEIVTWTSVDSGDANDPVIGYKLKVWVVPKIKKTIYKNQGGTVVRVLEESYPKININTIPDGLPTEIITSANETTAIFHDVHVDVAYQFAVLAFTASGEGPLSAPVRIRLLNKKTDVNKDDFGKTETKY